MEKIVYPDQAAMPVEPAFDADNLTDEQLEAALPVPCGHKMLIAMPDVEDKYEGTSIIKVDETMNREQVTSVVALVLDMGPDAYKDKERFPSGPWCKTRDYVIVGPYKGTRFIVGNREYRLINDDSVEGVVADPRSYRRV